VLQHGQLGDVLVVVSRYFGGIKLGAGGLVRAYGNATQQALEQAPARTLRILTQCRVNGDFSAEQGLRHWLAGVDGEMLAVDYGQPVEFTLALPAGQLDELAAYCSAGGLQLLPA
jgi:putative IMPACT (imprinted ancient) family translation regulator